MLETTDVPVNEYEGGRRKYADVRCRLAEIDAEIRQLESARWQALDDGREARFDAAAQAFLDGTPQTVTSDDRRLEELRAEREVASRAVKLAGQKFGALRDARNRAATSELRPVHREAVQRIASLLIDLARANEEEARVRMAAPGGGLPYLGWPGVHLGQDSSVRHYLKMLARHGVEANAPINGKGAG